MNSKIILVMCLYLWQQIYSQENVGMPYFPKLQLARAQAMHNLAVAKTKIHHPFLLLESNPNYTKDIHNDTVITNSDNFENMSSENNAYVVKRPSFATSKGELDELYGDDLDNEKKSLEKLPSISQIHLEEQRNFKSHTPISSQENVKQDIDKYSEHYTHNGNAKNFHNYDANGHKELQLQNHDLVAKTTNSNNLYKLSENSNTELDINSETSSVSSVENTADEANFNVHNLYKHIFKPVYEYIDEATKFNLSKINNSLNFTPDPEKKENKLEKHENFQQLGNIVRPDQQIKKAGFKNHQDSSRNNKGQHNIADAENILFMSNNFPSEKTPESIKTTEKNYNKFNDQNVPHRHKLVDKTEYNFDISDNSAGKERFHFENSKFSLANAEKLRHKDLQGTNNTGISHNLNIVSTSENPLYLKNNYNAKENFKLENLKSYEEDNKQIQLENRKVLAETPKKVNNLNKLNTSESTSYFGTNLATKDSSNIENVKKSKFEKYQDSAKHIKVLDDLNMPNTKADNSYYSRNSDIKESFKIPKSFEQNIDELRFGNLQNSAKSIEEIENSNINEYSNIPTKNFIPEDNQNASKNIEISNLNIVDGKENNLYFNKNREQNFQNLNSENHQNFDKNAKKTDLNTKNNLNFNSNLDTIEQNYKYLKFGNHQNWTKNTEVLDLSTENSSKANVGYIDNNSDTIEQNDKETRFENHQYLGKNIKDLSTENLRKINAHFDRNSSTMEQNEKEVVFEDQRLYKNTNPLDLNTGNPSKSNAYSDIEQSDKLKFDDQRLSKNTKALNLNIENSDKISPYFDKVTTSNSYFDSNSGIIKQNENEDENMHALNFNTENTTKKKLYVDTNEMKEEHEQVVHELTFKNYRHSVEDTDALDNLHNKNESHFNRKSGRQESFNSRNQLYKSNIQRLNQHNLAKNMEALSNSKNSADSENIGAAPQNFRDLNFKNDQKAIIDSALNYLNIDNFRQRLFSVNKSSTKENINPFIFDKNTDNSGFLDFQESTKNYDGLTNSLNISSINKNNLDLKTDFPSNENENRSILDNYREHNFKSLKSQAHNVENYSRDDSNSEYNQNSQEAKKLNDKLYYNYNDNTNNTLERLILEEGQGIFDTPKVKNESQQYSNLYPNNDISNKKDLFVKIEHSADNILPKNSYLHEQSSMRTLHPENSYENKQLSESLNGKINEYGSSFKNPLIHANVDETYVNQNQYANVEKNFKKSNTFSKNGRLVTPYSKLNNIHHATNFEMFENVPRFDNQPAVDMENFKKTSGYKYKHEPKSTQFNNGLESILTSGNPFYYQPIQNFQEHSYSNSFQKLREYIDNLHKDTERYSKYPSHSQYQDIVTPSSKISYVRTNDFETTAQKQIQFYPELVSSYLVHVPLNYYGQRYRREIINDLGTKKSVPLINLITDPYAKLDLKKTITNIGTVAKKTFEDKQTPMFHFRNMLGSAKNALLSAMMVPPQDMIIPGKYKIINKNSLKQDILGAIPNESVNIFPDDIFLGSDLNKIFQKVGTMMRESIQSGQDAMQHAYDVAHNARKAVASTNQVIPGLLLPIAKIPKVIKEKRPRKLTLITPRIADVVKEPSPNSDDYVKVGAMLDALGISDANQNQLGSAKFIIHPKTIEPKLQSRFGNVNDISEEKPGMYIVGNRLEHKLNQEEANEVIEILHKVKEVPDKNSWKNFLKTVKRSPESGKNNNSLPKTSQNEDVGIGMPLTKDMLKPFMGMLRGKDIKSLDSTLKESQPKSTYVAVQDHEDIENEAFRNFIAQYGVVSAINPQIYQNYFHEPLRINHKNDANLKEVQQEIANSNIFVSTSNPKLENIDNPSDNIDEVQTSMDIPEDLLKPFMGKLSKKEMTPKHENEHSILENLQV